MKAMTYVYLGAGALVLLAIAYIAARGASNVGKAAGAAIVGGASDLAGGAIQGGASVLGVPMTDDAKCQACIAARDWWGASKYCPALTWAKALVSSPASSAEASGDASSGASSSSSLPTAVTPPKTDWENRLEGVWL